MTRTIPALCLGLCLALLSALPARAAEFATIRDRTAFLSRIEGRKLRNGLSIRLSADGSVSGRALGWGITGSWAWKNGCFCREWDWSGTPIRCNCQLVEARGTRELRFAVDQAAGDSAPFTLR